MNTLTATSHRITEVAGYVTISRLSLACILISLLVAVIR